MVFDSIHQNPIVLKGKNQDQREIKMTETTKVSFSVDKDLLQEIKIQMNTPPVQNQTQVLNDLIYKGLTYEKKIQRLKNREEYILLKLLYMMRVLASSRGDNFLQEIDENFQKDLVEMKELILEEGMDFINGSV